MKNFNSELISLGVRTIFKQKILKSRENLKFFPVFQSFCLIRDVFICLRTIRAVFLDRKSTFECESQLYFCFWRDRGSFSLFVLSKVEFWDEEVDFECDSELEFFFEKRPRAVFTSRRLDLKSILNAKYSKIRSKRHFEFNLLYYHKLCLVGAYLCIWITFCIV